MSGALTPEQQRLLNEFDTEELNEDAARETSATAASTGQTGSALTPPSTGTAQTNLEDTIYESLLRQSGVYEMVDNVIKTKSFTNKSAKDLLLIVNRVYYNSQGANPSRDFKSQIFKRLIADYKKNPTETKILWHQKVEQARRERNGAGVVESKTGDASDETEDPPPSNAASLVGVTALPPAPAYTLQQMIALFTKLYKLNAPNSAANPAHIEEQRLVKQGFVKHQTGALCSMKNADAFEYVNVFLRQYLRKTDGVVVADEQFELDARRELITISNGTTEKVLEKNPDVVKAEVSRYVGDINTWPLRDYFYILCTQISWAEFTHLLHPRILDDTIVSSNRHGSLTITLRDPNSFAFRIDFLTDISVRDENHNYDVRFLCTVPNYVTGSVSTNRTATATAAATATATGPPPSIQFEVGWDLTRAYDALRNAFSNYLTAFPPKGRLERGVDLVTKVDLQQAVIDPTVLAAFPVSVPKKTDPYEAMPLLMDDYVKHGSDLNHYPYASWADWATPAAFMREDPVDKRIRQSRRRENLGKTAEQGLEDAVREWVQSDGKPQEERDALLAYATQRQRLLDATTKSTAIRAGSAAGNLTQRTPIDALPTLSYKQQLQDALKEHVSALVELDFIGFNAPASAEPASAETADPVGAPPSFRQRRQALQQSEPALLEVVSSFPAKRYRLLHPTMNRKKDTNLGTTLQRVTTTLGSLVQIRDALCAKLVENVNRGMREPAQDPAFRAVKEQLWKPLRTLPGVDDEKVLYLAGRLDEFL